MVWASEFMLVDLDLDLMLVSQCLQMSVST